MKILDSNGRIFGKINLIDFMVIIFVVCLTPVFYFGYKISKKPVKETIQEEYTQVEIPAKFIKLNVETSKLITVGDKELDRQSQEVIGEVIWQGEILPSKSVFDLGSNEIITKEDQRLKEVYCRIKINAAVRDNTLYYKGQRVMVGSPLNFKTGKYTILIIPVSALEMKKFYLRKKQEAYLNVFFKDLSEDTLKLISEGDKQINENGEVIAEVAKVGKIENNSLEINLGSGNFVTVEELAKKQMSVKLRLKGEIDQDGLLYFDNLPINYNYRFTFKTDKYAVECQAANLLSNEKWIEIRVRFSGIIPELAGLISGGDTEKELGVKLVGRLKSIVSSKTSEIQTLSVEQNKIITIPQPYTRDIEVILNLLCSEKGGVFYYKNYPVKIGNLVTFTTDLYNISGQIVGMEGI